jgi:hypothetical protein
MISRQHEQIHLRENLSRTVQAVLFWRTPIELAKRFAKPIVGLKPVFQGNIDDPFALSKLYESIGQIPSRILCKDAEEAGREQRSMPAVSAQNHLFGQFDFTPLRDGVVLFSFTLVLRYPAIRRCNKIVDFVERSIR